ncbi:MAG: HAMP domain-containing protein [Candidatus Thermoplasmatota archaeon]|nr:HAMP domain-containing protein [Candidatus Thermoplasmatota archaeon]MBU4071035.1 HAMP domain-containing protein [Candidatus Thermoplasmatota archaeon]MBU4145118.1 HAMP domain-containing protein [Candidatus Thermoplasmatota archaeon]MBU4591024.1 HAMP domain-containing protein [Candidatus Thermoplasmatota archaeon]
MNMRRKTVLTTVFIIIILFTSLFFVSKSIMLAGFEKLEMGYAERNLNRTISALNGEIDGLDMKLYDWAAWDDTYHFIDEPNQGYLDSNIVTGTFTGLELNVILYVDLNATVIFGKTLDRETEDEYPNSAELIDSIMANDLLFDLPYSESYASGLIRTCNGPMIVASRPTQNSACDSPLNGAMLMGRFFDNDVSERLSELVNLPVTFYLTNEDKPADFNEAERHLNESDEPNFIQTIDKDYIAGYTIINDINDSSLFIIKTEMPRDIYQYGVASFNYFQIALLIVMSIIGSITLLTLDMVVVKRLSILNSEVKTIAHDENRSTRISVSGKDEISSLASEVNLMLDSIEESEKVRGIINDKLTSKVVELERSDKASLNIMEDLNETVDTLKSMEKKLATKNKELEDYTYTVSHDLKAPLVTIQGFSDLLASNYAEKLDDKGRHYIDRINQGSERLNALISDLLELSRAGRKLKPFQWHDFNEIIKGSLESLEGKISGANVKVVHPNDFPKIYGDDMRLSQVVNNLVGNAVNYMGEQKSPQVNIGWKESGAFYEFWVQDNGIGIKDEDKTRIFNIFERASEGGAEGSGIGLSIVKKIVETHGGEIRVESVFGKGSKFIFTIPKKGADE